MVAAFCGFSARPSLRPHAGPAPRRRYERRRPEKTPLHKIISENLASWLEWRDEAERPVPGYVEEELRGYLECGILCFGFGRALCTGCGQGFVIAFSCKGRGVCSARLSRARQPWEPLAFPSAARQDGAMDGPPCLWLVPPVPVRQWVISVPKRLRGFLADRPAAVAALTRIFIEEIERLLGAVAGVTSVACAPAAARPRLGAISFLHRFGSALNHHVHLHVCATDGVFMPAAGGAGCCASPAFLPAHPINQADLAALTERVRRRVIRFPQAHSPARHRCRRRHAHVGEQRFFSRCQCSDHAQ
ncbi:MAG: transposase [Planctomycetes bacterium]|nr:transposase [Planctomycetota bacterium]